jgi:hypothetical protein
MARLNAHIEIRPRETPEDKIVFEAGEIDYISFVNHDTHGIPPLITKHGPQPSVAEVGDRVLYVNPDAFVSMDVELLG